MEPKVREAYDQLLVAVGLLIDAAPTAESAEHCLLVELSVAIERFEKVKYPNVGDARV